MSGLAVRVQPDGTLKAFRIEPGTSLEDVQAAMLAVGFDSDGIDALGRSTGVAKARGASSRSGDDEDAARISRRAEEIRKAYPPLRARHADRHPATGQFIPAVSRRKSRWVHLGSPHPGVLVDSAPE